MHPQVTKLYDLNIYPYYRSVPVELAPLATGGEGIYVEGCMLGHQYYELEIASEVPSSPFVVGGTYYMTGYNELGGTMQTHWLYCTSVAPKLVFGLTCNWSKSGSESPLLARALDPYIRLEKVTDIVSVVASPPPAIGLVTAQMGGEGWIVMTSLTTPFKLGVLIEDPIVSPGMSEGTGNISISATSVRTLQTIGLERLICQTSSAPAVFLQGDLIC